ncbi:MAG TPA: asparagine synthase-related protein [Thermomicrobiales bacterium]|nr:asparagine synthase-related protein [Thermomicrobiales bacterium]
MSGLALVFHRDGRPADEAAVWAMLAAAPYRGPDGLAVRAWGAIALGHAKMAVTPEEEDERQPLVSPRTGCAVIADVRLDNREELLARLPDRPAPGVSDAELLLRGYEAWSEELPARLLGDFAFALWDPRRRRLLCARDTGGQRTLFYRAGRHTFEAASEVHQLLQDPAVPLVANEERIRDSLLPWSIALNAKDHPHTFFAGIDAVPAGHALVVEPDNLRQWRYWELQPPAELRYRTDDEYAEHYLSVFSEVVRARLRSTRPLGALLSGGLDSSSIVCTAHELFRTGRATNPGFASYSLVFGGLDCDESDLIRDIQAKYGFPARYLTVVEATGPAQLEPRGFMESPNMGLLDGRDATCNAAVADGARVLLTGEVGDSCVYGSRAVFDSLLRQGRLREFWRHFRAYRRVTDESLRQFFALVCLAPLLPLEIQKRLMLAHVRRELRREQHRLLPLWMAEPLREDLFQGHRRQCLARERGRRFANLTREMEFRMLYPPEVARHPAPWPIEIWHPFADRRLHEFVLAIPPEQKFAPYPGTAEYYAGAKRIVRRAMRGILPESVRTRRVKTMFNAVIVNEVQRNWPAYEAAFGPAARPEIAARGYVDQARFWARLQDMRNGDHGLDRVYLMQLVGLETWFRALALPRPQAVTVAPPFVPDWRPPAAASDRGLAVPAGTT